MFWRSVPFGLSASFPSAVCVSFLGGVAADISRRCGGGYISAVGAAIADGGGSRLRLESSAGVAGLPVNHFVVRLPLFDSKAARQQGEWQFSSFCEGNRESGSFRRSVKATGRVTDHCRDNLHSRLLRTGRAATQQGNRLSGDGASPAVVGW
nr:hypothetical protein Itr_chr05CG12910 [Ipomoea trifida]